MAILRCKEAFSIDIDGIPHVFAGGQLVDSSHAVVKGREHLFEPVDTYMSRSTVEQATAEPGQARTVSTTKRSARK